MWISVALATDAVRAEALSEALLAHGALSVSIEDAWADSDREQPQYGEPGSLPDSLWEQSRVVALFEPAEDLIGLIGRAALDAGIDDLPEIELTDVAEQDWVRLTQSQFEPIRINDRLWIVPSWHREGFSGKTDSDIRIIQLDPGLAFGTGSHPTTRLCLEWLCDAVRPGDTVLDYGCGSGILAIAAALFGATRVVGIDIDEKALEAAQSNAADNKVVLSLLHSREPMEERFDIVVANILTNPLKVLAPVLADRVAPGGRLALSGVLAEQADDVIAAYAPHIALHVAATRDGWCRLEGIRRPC